MPDPTLIGLGFQGNNSNRFQSVNPNQAPGSASFYACVLVNLQESLLTSPVEASYFGNFNDGTAPNVFGWDIGRDADTPASDPPATPELVTLRVRIGHGATTTTLSFTTDAAAMFGRTHLIGVSVIGLVATMYVNGAAVAQDTFVGAFNLGRSGLTYGNIAGGGSRSGDPVISAAYSDSDAADFIAQQRALFEGIRTSGKLAATITALGLVAGYIYESFQQKAPISGVPTTPLKNFGTFGSNGDLVFAGSVALVINADPDPDYTGGAQSASAGGGENLQAAYDAGPTGLIATGVPGPVGVDELRFEDGLITVSAGDLEIAALDSNKVTIRTPPGAPGRLELISGDGLTSDAGEILLFGGLGDGVNPGGPINILGGGAAAIGGAITVQSGTSTADVGGDITIQSGDGGVVAPDGFAAGNLLIAGGVGGDAVDGGTGGTGGQIILTSGDGGDATGATANAGQGGELNIEAGGAGAAAGGAAEGVGGLLNLSAGNGGTGIGGIARLHSGNGDVASGGLNIFVGTSSGIVGALLINGGAANGIGSGPGGTVRIEGGAAASGEPQDGGVVEIVGGAGGGGGGDSGGGVSIDGGVASNGGGGTVAINGGAGQDVGNGGNVQIGGGVSIDGVGGLVDIAGGFSSTVDGGAIQITGGQSGGTGAAQGGNVSIRGGASTGDTGETGGSIALLSGQGADPDNAGHIEAAFAGAGGVPTATIGGFYLDPLDGRLSLRTYAIGGGVDSGSLKLHVLNEAGEVAQAITNGLVHYQTAQFAGTTTTVGYRVAKSGDYGLMGRIFQRTFDAAEGVTFAVVHNLDCNAPGVFMYNSATGALIPLVSVVQNSVNQVTVTIGGAVDGFVTVIGF